MVACIVEVTYLIGITFVSVVRSLREAIGLVYCFFEARNESKRKITCKKTGENTRLLHEKDTC